MPVRLYAHLSWTTDGRLSMIDRPTEAFLRRFIPTEARRHDVRVLAVGIVADHVHLALRLPAVANIPRIVQGFKGASARLINEEYAAENRPLKWASGYDLRSVSPENLDRVINYVRNQPRCHPDRAVGHD